jgi:hypothetical protein
MMIFFVNKNYLSFVLIFDFSQLIEKCVDARGYKLVQFIQKTPKSVFG